MRGCAVGADDSVGPLERFKFVQHSVGADAHIGPLGSCEFAEDSRKNGAFRRADVGIGPYSKAGSCIRIRRTFSENRCILRADRVVRPYKEARQCIRMRRRSL